MFTSTFIETPLGTLIAHASETHLHRLAFIEPGILEQEKNNSLNTSSKILKETALQLGEYFSGNRAIFNLPLALQGTDFQKTAWHALEKIPYGETRNYREQAGLAGNPRAVRAIGGANNKNPILIIIPCHRVIGSSGDLVGYAAGLDRKKWLLEHEKRYK